MKNKTKIGRPAFTLNYPTGVFTVNDLFEMNHERKRGRGKSKVCKLTVIKHIESGLRSKLIKKLKDRVVTGKVGQPPIQYTLTEKGVKKLGAGTPTEPLVQVNATETITTAPAPVPVVAQIVPSLEIPLTPLPAVAAVAEPAEAIMAS